MALELNSATAQKLFVTFQAIFNETYTAVPTFYQEFASEIPSGSTTQLHHWLGQLPSMRQWIGDRIVHAPALRDYTLTNLNFENTIALNKFKIADDQYGAFGPTVKLFADACKRWPDEQMAAAVEAATTALCYDGQAMFATAHPVSTTDSTQGTYSNKLVGATYDWAADPIGAWQRGSEAMAAFVGDSGKPLALVADTVMVPPQLRRWAVQAAKAELVPQTFTSNSNANASAAGVGNVYVGDFTVIVNPYLTSSAAYIMCRNRPVKPFVWQLRQAPVFTPAIDPALPNVFYGQELVYGAEARGVAGYSLPWLAIRMSAS